ncbi:dihydrofolate reductase [Gimibacter soli]|uniref:Dihydrofolate reductase n=1 Tax=Gimibacter soli TaxID=3024400 RepID=A0AAF0BLU8_9PROT|nr:dihydrofolate reductase [Gimibacter soli]WCL53566.1 dihydrofolate reductase [Gimibacter soli]
MTLEIVVAMAANRIIGRDNGLPWHLPADLKHFKAVTMGKPVVMGRKTFESIGRPLPGRRNIVVTRNADWRAEGVDATTSLEAGIALAGEASDTVMVIGGADIYRQALPKVGRIHLTEVDVLVDGDASFPALDSAEWREVTRESHPAEEGRPAYSFVTLERR